MAAPAYQTVSNATWVINTTPVVITKPTGLAEGDNMLAIIGAVSDDGSAVSAPSTPASWTLAASVSFQSNLGRLYAFTKVADAADVAAANFSFTVDASVSVSGGSILRISGGATALVGASGTAEDAVVDTTVTGTVSVDTILSDSLVVMAWLTRDTTTATFSGYTISGTNPSWTEVADSSGNSSQDPSLGIAVATLADHRTITSFSATTNNSPDNAGGLLLVCLAPTAVSVTPNSIALRVQQTAPTMSAVVNITPASLSLRAQQSAPTTANNDNIWSNQSKTDTTWTNQDK